MRTFAYSITDPIGLHARPAGMLVKEVKKYQSKITIEKEGKTCDAGKLMMLMGLGVKHGDTITVAVEGSDEEMAAKELAGFFQANL